MARPKKNIDGKQIERLASYGLNNVEIAESFSVNETTLRNNYSEFLTKGRLDIKTKLRRAQIKAALSGNVVMLIWLGKNMLGQSDKVETKNDINIEVTRSEIDFVDGKEIEVEKETVKKKLPIKKANKK